MIPTELRSLKSLVAVPIVKVFPPNCYMQYFQSVHMRVWLRCSLRNSWAPGHEHTARRRSVGENWRQIHCQTCSCAIRRLWAIDRSDNRYRCDLPFLFRWGAWLWWPLLPWISDSVCVYRLLIMPTFESYILACELSCSGRYIISNTLS